RAYPIEGYADDVVGWNGNTERRLGLVHLCIENPILSDTYTIRLRGSANESDAFGQIIEVAEPDAGGLGLMKSKKNDKKKE
ncbi:MAG: hypothetical protein K2H08_09080, partial [Duncaniella sp.]|nr:hypothetical protein [Duncaniella sp.]